MYGLHVKIRQNMQLLLINNAPSHYKGQVTFAKPLKIYYLP